MNLIKVIKHDTGLFSIETNVNDELIEVKNVNAKLEVENAKCLSLPIGKQEQLFEVEANVYVHNDEYYIDEDDFVNFV